MADRLRGRAAFPSWTLLTVLALTGLLPTGCGGRPRAPALEDSPVYQNDREGFRFLVPDGWQMTARADVPPGPAAKERLLVQYQAPAERGPATFVVSLADLPAGADLGAYLEGPSYGAGRWQRQGKAEALEVGGVPAVRLDFTGRVGKEKTAREVTAFPRGGRTYFFTVLYPPGDVTAREQVRRAVASTVWR